VLEYGDIFERAAIHHDQVRALAWLEHPADPEGFRRRALVTVFTTTQLSMPMRCQSRALSAER